MQRRWGFRLKQGRREARTPDTPAEQERRQRARLLLVTLTLGLALWAILAVRLPTVPGLSPGKPSPIDIRAPRSITFVSKLLTEQERIRAESAADTVKYTLNTDIPIQQRAQLSDLLQTITQVRDDPSLSQSARIDKITSMPLPSSTLVISRPLAAAISRLPAEQWATVRQEALNLYDRAMRGSDYALSEEALAQLRERSLPYWSAQVARGEQQRMILLFSQAFLQANRVLDEEATRQSKQAAREAVEPVTVQIQQGESIVHAGDIVTPAAQEKLEAIGELHTTIDWLGEGGRGLLAALIAGVFGLYISQAQRDLWMNTRPLLVVVGLFALMALVARLVLPLGGQWPYIFPLAVIGLLLTMLFNRGLALVATTLLALLIGLLGDNQASLAASLLLGAMVGILVVGRGERSLTFLVAGLAIAAVTALTQLAAWLTTPGGPPPDEWAPILLFSGANGSLAAILALGLYNLIGHMADVVTPLQLMELSHPAHPLLRKLIREAPGTYYHSVAVGNLAESAAEAIGADALLLRVASYYHDIGKTIRPYFFTDNQSDRENVHNELDPHISAEIIAEHVSEGVKLARAAGLPRQIVEFIPAHHGTSVIKHFYQMALQREDTVNVEDYCYPGPRPRTREQAIMMLADTVEATVRSKAQNGKIISSREEHGGANGRGQGDKYTLEELVSSIIDERIRSCQLDESDLTLHDIARIRQAFINSLQSIYHPRVDYAPQVVKH